MNLSTQRIRRFFVTLTELDQAQLDDAGLYEQPTMIIHQLHLIILRLGLVALAVVCWRMATHLGDDGDTIRQPLSLQLMFVMNITAFGLFFLAVFRRLRRQAMHIIPVVLLLLFVSQAQMDRVSDRQQGGEVSSDVWLFSEYSTQLLLEGQNPYEHDMTHSFWVHRVPPLFSTPLIDGDYVTRVSYPALSIWLFVPFQLLGISTTYIYPMFAYFTILALFYATPRMLRPIVLLPILVEPRYFYFVFGGVNDIVWAFFIIMMIQQWRSPIRRALWYGLACAFKQQAWIFAPFLLIKLWQESRDQTPSQRIFLLAEAFFSSVTVFMVFNLPFMLWNFDAWLSGVTTPFVEPMIVLGQGLSALTLAGVVVPPNVYFTLVRLGVLGLLLYLVLRHYDDWSELIWIAPGVVLWFGYRSLVSYWYFYALPLVMALVTSIWKLPMPQAAVQAQHRRYKTTLSVVAVATTAFLGSLIYFYAQPPAITFSIQTPVAVEHGTIRNLTLTVENRSDEPLYPRFAVRQWGWQPFFWDVQTGPAMLAPHSQAVYTISTDYPPYMFNIERGAQITVSDAERYAVRRSAVLEGDIALRFVDAIPNGEFRYWQDNRPFLWGLMGSGTVRYNEDVEVIELEAAAAEAGHQQITMLDTWVPVPTVPVGVHVKVPAEANHLPDLTSVYGYEIVLTSTQARIWVLFGDQNRHGQLGENWYYWMEHTPRDEWVRQTLDIQQILRALELDPAPTPVLRQQINYPLPMMNFRLLVANSTPQATVAFFGPVHLQSMTPDRSTLVEDYLENPEVFLTWRGNQALSQRAFGTALDYFTLALENNPDYAPAYLGLSALSEATASLGPTNANTEQAIAENPNF